MDYGLFWVVGAVVRMLVAAALLGLGWLLTPRTAPPLYDGVGFPDEPYRFVVAPAGAPKTTKAPTVARTWTCGWRA